VGFYFFQPKEDVVATPIIVAPTIKDDVEKTRIIIEKPNKVEVVTTPVVAPKKSKTIKKSSTIITAKVKKEAIALNDLNINKEQNDSLVNHSEKENLLVEQESMSEGKIKPITVEDEIEQLLKNSQMKLAINGDRKKRMTVDAKALLLEAEDDLDKDLKQILFDKVINTLKSQKEQVTYREN